MSLGKLYRQILNALLRWFVPSPDNAVPIRDERLDPSPDEYVLRRFSAGYFDSEAPPEDAVDRLAFQPNEKEDFDGLSLFREAFMDPAALAAKGRGKLGYYLARLRVDEIMALGVTVKAAPDPEMGPGHCVIPELCAGLGKEAKRLSKDRQQSLAKIAAKDIVYRPSGLNPPRP